MRTEKEQAMWTKAEKLTAKLTLDEKIGMVHGAELFQTKGAERLGIPPLKMSDGPMGVRQEFHPAGWKPVGYSDDYVTYLPATVHWRQPGIGTWLLRPDLYWVKKPEEEARMSFWLRGSTSKEVLFADGILNISVKIHI